MSFQSRHAEEPIADLEREHGRVVTEALHGWATRRGYRMACGDISLLDKARSEIQAFFEAGVIDADLYRTELALLCGGSPEEIARPGRILIIAVPRPAHTVQFALKGRSTDALLPPTYVDYSALPETVQKDLQQSVGDKRFRLIILDAPLKALAARMGLVRYGRNNISYIEGLGSYFQLAGYITETLLETDSEQPPQTLSTCGTCGACVACCPGGAIGEDRFLLNGARCLTLFTENEGDWPGYFRPSMLECMVGCLACQEACPENAGLLRFEPSGVSFPEDETAAILAGGPRRGPLWDRIREKLATLQLLRYEPVITRNLRVLVSGGAWPPDSPSTAIDRT